MRMLEPLKRSSLSRRGFLSTLAATTAASAFTRVPGRSQSQTAPVQFNAVQDLTHPLSSEFPVFPGFEPFNLKPRTTIEEDGFYTNRWDFVPHDGTHLDAPNHFAQGKPDVASIPVDQFVAPLAVVSIQKRAQQNADAQLLVDDITAWEQAHGPLPQGAVVAAYTGWEERLSEPGQYLNQDEAGTLHFPGFHPDTAQLLVENREIRGIGIDTASVDFGPSTAFEVHGVINGAEKYIVENLANLASVPSVGASIIIGVPKVKSASGGPARALAVW